MKKSYKRKDPVIVGIIIVIVLFIVAVFFIMNGIL